MRETPARFDISPVLRFLRCRSPQAWSDQAATDPDALLLDHAALELKAAQQAQRLISKYGAAAGARRPDLSDAFRSRLSKQMSRLAREELRHFEQVIAVIERRGGRFRAVSPSRYAASLHALARSTEPSAMLDSLLKIGRAHV